jgi:hypothetical protein
MPSVLAAAISAAVCVADSQDEPVWEQTGNDATLLKYMEGLETEGMVGTASLDVPAQPPSNPAASNAPAATIRRNLMRNDGILLLVCNGVLFMMSSP